MTSRNLRVFWGLALLVSLSCAGALEARNPTTHAIQKQLLKRTGSPYLPPTAGHDKQLAFTVPSCPLTMDHVVQTTLINNRHLRALYGDLGIAQAALWQAGILVNPVGDLSLKHLNLTRMPYILEFSVLQNLLDIFLRPLRIRAACAGRQEVQVQFVSQIINTISEAKQAYIQMRHAEQMLTLEEELCQLSDIANEIALRFHEAGSFSELDVLPYQLASQQNKTRLLMRKEALELSKQKLNKFMGLAGPAADAWRLDQVPWNLPAADLYMRDTIQQLAVCNNLQLVQLRAQAHSIAARGGLEIAHQLLPEFGLGIEGEREPEGVWFLGPKFASALPLWDWGQARRKGVHAALFKVHEEYHAVEVDVRAEARLLEDQWENAWQQAKLASTHVLPLSRQNLSTTQSWYNAMQVGVFHLLDAKKLEATVQQETLDTLYHLFSVQLRLQQLLSGGQPHALM